MTDPILPNDADASGRSFGPEERALLEEVLASGTLNGTRGTQVPALERELAAMFGVKHARALASGTAAVHTAVAAIDPEPGDEIITTPITDMGAIAAILYQTAIPIFVDVDPETCNVTAASIAARITSRTRAVIVTHLFGNPAVMGEIVDLCRTRNLPLIEDAAQALLARCDGRLVGTIGDVGCFSLQQGKHITSGEGGFVLTDDDALARRMRLFSDKAWGYGDAQPDHYFLAPNYRMTELQAAVARGQLGKLAAMTKQRVTMAQRLTKALAGLQGVEAPAVRAGCEHSYWRYALRVDPAVLAGGAVRLGALLKERGIACAPRYIQKPAFECEVLRDQRTFGGSRFPFVGPHRDGEPAVVYRKEDTPGAYDALARVVVLPWNERYEARHVDFLAEAIRSAATRLAAEAAAR